LSQNNVRKYRPDDMKRFLVKFLGNDFPTTALVWVWIKVKNINTSCLEASSRS
jgi:hypothetical protein